VTGYAVVSWSGSGNVMKVGILGGTFDPVHNGHLLIAEEARVSLGLAEVIFIPAGQPLLKAARPIAPAEHRLEMLRLALAGKPRYRLATMEVERPGPSYTVDTLAEMRKGGAEDELFFIVGWDKLGQLPRWREPARIITMCRLVAVPRPGFTRPDLKSLEADIPGISRRVVFLGGPQVDISASAIRESAARGLSLSGLVPGPVADYIRQHGLYSN
jgi:nicotinate-nucleotide adenylyltransferase